MIAVCTQGEKFCSEEFCLVLSLSPSLFPFCLLLRGLWVGRLELEENSLLTSAQRNSRGLGETLPTEHGRFPLSLPHSYSVLVCLDGSLRLLNVAHAHVESLEKPRQL